MIEQRTVTHEWETSPNASRSIRRANGQVVGTNHIINPAAGGSYVSLTRAVASDRPLGSRPRSFRLPTTSSAFSDFPMPTSDKPVAAPGETWWGHALIQADSTVIGTRGVRLNCRFLDGPSGAVLGSTNQIISTAPQGLFRRWTGAANASASEEYSATAKRTNLAPGARGQAGVSYGTGETVTRNIATPMPSPNGSTTALRVSFTSGLGNVGFKISGLPVPSLGYVFISAWVYAETAAPPSMAVAISGVAAGGTLPLVQGQWTRIWGVVRQNSGTTMDAGMRAAGGTQNVGSFLVTDIQIEVVPGAAVDLPLYPFFDGDTKTPLSGKVRSWAGAANASASVERGADNVTRVNYAVDATGVVHPEAGGGWLRSRWWAQGTGTYASVTGITDGPLPGITAYARKTWNTASTSSGDTGFENSRGSTNGVPVSPGEVISISSYLRASAPHGVASIQIKWLDATGAAINSAYISGPNTPLAANVWTRLTLTATAPALTAYLHIVSDVDGSEPWPAGSTLDGTGLLIERSATVGPYFDGSLPSEETIVLPTGTDTNIYELQVALTAPAGTKNIDFAISRLTTTIAPDGVLDVFWATELALTKMAPGVTPLYFDGDSPQAVDYVNVERPGALTTDEWVEIDGIPLNTLAYNITTWGGDRISPPAVRGANIVVPGRPGQQFMAKELDANTQTLNMWVQGTDTSGRQTDRSLANEFDKNWRMLRNLLFTPRKQRRMTKRWYDPVSRAIRSATGLVSYGGGLEPTMTGRARGVFQVTLVVDGTFFYETPYVLPVSTTQQKTWTVNVDGDWRTTAIKAEIRGPRVNPKITFIDPSGAEIWFQYNGTLVAGEYIEIDVDNFSVMLTSNNTVRSVSGRLSHGGDKFWGALEPGENKIVLTSSNGVGGAIVSYQQVWF